MRIKIELTTDDVKQLIVEHLQSKLEEQFDPLYLTIRTKSAQNYKAEWENAEITATYERVVK